MEQTAQKLRAVPKEVKECKMLLLGFGNVGQAFAQMCLDKASFGHGVRFVFIGVVTGAHGFTYQGGRPLDMAQILSLYASSLPQEVDLCAFGTGDWPAAKVLDVASTLRLIAESGADVVVEAVPVNYDTGEPALSFLRKALECGMHGISANKGPVVHGFHDLSALAASRGKRYLFESAVMDGVPVFSLWRNLPGACLKGFRGVLNSTTNVILTAMEDGLTFERALQMAQAAGIAEADPAGDIDGWDAAVKVAALCTVLMDVPIKVTDVQREGISSLTQQQVEAAAAEGQRYKLMCSAQVEPSGQVVSQVRLEKLTSADSPFFDLPGPSSALQIYTDVLAPVTIVSSDPTTKDTAYGIFGDCLTAMLEQT
ncbi:hypothetical protein CYMTET_9998 [Cymbomonas tetramitiformis]|uniref:Homoserine dehydrogenase n=1 Tax=Cymbomonas tetramitiformis TaxID=36881 RepID=A0AAE0LEX6_9CHLO|nr:hypothetical protein CYMTET_9998 [Cymbomonas tetramitiformis]